MARNVILFFFIYLTSLAFAYPSESTSVSGDSGSKNEKFNPGEMIMHHIIDSHEWHILDWKEHSVSIPLPIIIFHEGKGLKSFMSSKFNHGKTSYGGYKMDHGKIVAVDSSGSINKEETQKLALIEANEYYVFDYIDPPSIMELKSEPQRAIICIIFMLFGMILSSGFVLYKFYSSRELIFSED